MTEGRIDPKLLRRRLLVIADERQVPRRGRRVEYQTGEYRRAIEVTSPRTYTDPIPWWREPIKFNKPEWVGVPVKSRKVKADAV